MDLLYKQLFEQILWSKSSGGLQGSYHLLIGKVFFSRRAKWKINYFAKYDLNCVNLYFYENLTIY